jgi:hypothetical protein
VPVVWATSGGFATPEEEARSYEETVAAIRAQRRADGWTEAQIRAVDRREVAIGMTERMVRAARGEPVRVDRTETARGVTQDWTYITPGILVVTFHNGRVTELRTSTR